MNGNARQYYHRAFWALHNATNYKLEPIVRSHLTAVAVHACQSLRECLDQLATDGADAEFVIAVKSLPHGRLIENIRNYDLHYSPLPVCVSRIQGMTMVSKPGHPITLTSSHGIGVSLQMQGPVPKVRRTRKSLKHASVTFGPTISFYCEGEKLWVHDFSTGKKYLLLDVLRTFLEQCHPLISDRASVASSPSEENDDTREP